MMAKLAKERLKKIQGNNIIPFSPNPNGQTEFWELTREDCPYKFIWLKGSLSSGKTNTGAAWFCDRRKRDPEARSLVTANSYPQLARSTLVGLAEYCHAHNIPLEPMGDRPEETGRMIAARRYCRIWGAYVYVVSADNFVGGAETGRGMQVRDIWYDEGAYGEEGALMTLSGRFPRGPGKLKGLGVITSSINRNDPYNYMYELFDKPDRTPEQQALYKSIKCLVTDNPHIDPDYVPSLLAQLSPQMAQIEIYSEYQVLNENRVYPVFDRVLNACTDTVQFLEELHVGLDFNIGKMSAVVFVKRGGLPRAVAELVDKRDTPDMIAAIKLAYPNHPIYVYPDASGGARSTNAGETDIALLRQAGFNVRVKAANPPVKDRVNVANAMLLNAVGDRRWKINVQQCPNLVKTLERQTYDVHGAPDKKSGLDHIGDAATYMIFYAYPIVQSQPYIPENVIRAY